MYVCVLFHLFHLIYKNTNTFEHTSNVNCKSPSLLETFVYNELKKQSCFTEEKLKFSHYRDKDKVEVDIIIENKAFAINQLRRITPINAEEL